jgi:thiol-disulfide isomerase/thioredoxin
MDSARTMTADQKKRHGHQIGSAYRNAAQALAGQGKNDEALEMLRRARSEFAGLPEMAGDIDSEIERYTLVGTPAAPIKAPVWLYAPAGTTDMPMTGHVTLLEFTAHWCGPCRESYPGINRLRAKYEASGFRVVLATRLYGYFGSEQNLDDAAEVARDREYFAKHEMPVPVAIGPKNPPAVAHPADHDRVRQRERAEAGGDDREAAGGKVARHAAMASSKAPSAFTSLFAIEEPDISSCFRLMEKHPRRAELVANHREPIGEWHLLHFHEDLAAVREQRVHALGVCFAVECEREIGASHRLGVRNIGAHQRRAADFDAGVQDLGLPIGRQVGIGLVPMPDDAGERAAEVLLVETERLLAGAAVIDVDIESHGRGHSLGATSVSVVASVQRSVLPATARSAQ